MKTKLLQLALSAVFLSACQMTDQGAILSGNQEFFDENGQMIADTGPKPLNAEQQISTYLERSLVDPYSVRSFSVEEPQRGLNFIAGAKHEPAWYTCFEYNARNRMGGYVGLQRYVAYYRNGQLVDVHGMSNPWPKHECR